MSITTYDELKTAVARWLKRDDLTAYIPDYIAFGERRLWYGDGGQFGTPPLRVTEMIVADTGSVSSGFVRPSNASTYPYLSTRVLSVQSGGVQWPLRYLAPQQFAEYELKTGNPSYFTEYSATALKVAPLGSVTFSHEYYARPLALSASVSTNTILTNYPDIYLYAACIEGAIETQNDALAARFSVALAGKIKSLQSSNHNIAAGGSLAVTVAR